MPNKHKQLPFEKFLPPISSLTEGILLIIAVHLLICGSVFLLLSILFTPFKDIYWILIVVMTACIFLTILFAILFVFSALIRKFVEKRSLLTRCKCLSLIGYGGVALCGIAPRICVFFFVGSDRHVNLFIAFISVATSILIYFIILLPNAKHFEVDYNLDRTSFSKIRKHFLFHIIAFIVAMRIVIEIFTDEWDISYIISCQIGYSLICGPSIFDFCQVLREGGVKLRNNNKNENGDVQNQEKEAGNYEIVKAAEIPDNKFKMNCKICLLEYCGTRIPRILRECGHTLCEGCANELLEKNNQKYLCCPFCQKVTVVKGPANLLAKNYVALEVVEKMK